MRKKNRTTLKSNKIMFKNASNILPGQLLRQYQATIRQQQQLLHLVQSVLPDELAKQVQHCVLSGRKVILYTHSASWSSQLRFYHLTILKKVVDSGWPYVQLLQIKIIPEKKATTPAKILNLPSADTIEQLRQLSNSQSNNKLGSALSRLSSTLEKLSQPGDGQKKSD